MLRKKIFYLLMLSFFFTFTLQADLDPDEYTYFTSSNNVCLQELYGQPAAGVMLQMDVWVGEQVGGDVEFHLHTVYGTTNANGYCYLVVGILNSDWDFLDEIRVTVASQDYTVLQEIGSYSEYSHTIYPRFAVVYDLDGDGLDDNIELQLAEKFKPVLHKHSYDTQADLSNVDWIMSGRSTLKAYIETGQSIYSSTLTSPSQLHVSLGEGDYDSFGRGDMLVWWRLDIHDTYRHQGAPSGQKPLYYHVYKDGSYYYLQYWVFFNMNDTQQQTVNHTWHEGDFEHVSFKISTSSLDPVAINLYRHEGGRTVSPSNCWWSSSNAPTYSGLSQGYNSSRTHLHVWIAANSHGMYNRYHEVYSLSASTDIDYCWDLEDEYTIDNVDYSPSGYNLYFHYDHLENLGEYRRFDYAHGYTWYSHYEPVKSSKPWLCFIGRFGQYWAEQCLIKIVIHQSPASPIFDEYGFPSHQWKSFTEDYSPLGFGNPLSSAPPFGVVSILFTADPSQGD